MVLKIGLIRQVVLLGAFALGTFAGTTKLAAAQTPASALLVVNYGEGDHSLAIVDPLTSKVVGRVPIDGPGEPHEVAVSADGKLAFVANPDYQESPENTERTQGDFISVIDIAARKELRRVRLAPGSYPHGIVFAGGKVYWVEEGHRLVGRYDPSSNQIDWMFGTGQHNMHQLVITKDLNKIFTANGDSHSVTVIEKILNPKAADVGSDKFDRWNLNVIPVGKAPDGIAMSPDEKEVWQVTRDDGGASIIDVGTKKVSQTINLNAKNPVRVKFTPDGKRVLILCNSEGGQLLILDAVTRNEIKRMKVGNRPHAIQVAPNSSHAYVTNEEHNSVAIIDMKTLELTGHITTGTRPGAMAWAETR